MASIFRRDCNECGNYYEGRGKKYCSPECAQEAQRKESEQEVKFEDIPPEGEVAVEEDHREDTYLIQVKGRKEDAPKTLEDLLELTEADLDVWEVVKWQIKPYTAFFKHEVKQKAVRIPMYSSYIRFQKRDDRFIQQAMDKSIEKMKEHAPSYKDLPPRENIPLEKQTLMEMVLPDIHLGMLAHYRETGGNYDSKISIQNVHDAVDNLTARAQVFDVDKILLVVGNDLTHSDQTINGSGAATHRGTPLDTDTRRYKMVERACDLMVAVIEKCMAIANVDVLAVPGNHDWNESLSIARYLKAWFRNTDRVNVDVEPMSRKYYQYGDTFLGFAHGNEEKVKDLPLIMATERPDLWAETKYREWHLGHVHRKKAYHTMYVNEEHGVRVRHLSALTGTDAWHFKKGYTANIRAAEIFIWKKTGGLSAMFNWNLVQ